MHRQLKLIMMLELLNINLQDLHQLHQEVLEQLDQELILDWKQLHFE